MTKIQEDILMDYMGAPVESKDELRKILPELEALVPHLIKRWLEQAYLMFPNPLVSLDLVYKIFDDYDKEHGEFPEHRFEGMAMKKYFKKVLGIV